MKSYYNKAKDYLITSRSVRTKHYEELKKQAEEEKRTALEFCVWYDFQLVDKAKLDVGVFSCILDLVNNKHISLHTPNCLLETYKNTLALLRLDVKIEYVFEDELKTRRFKLFNLMPDESMFLPKLATPAPEPIAAEAPTVEATATADDDDEDLPF